MAAHELLRDLSEKVDPSRAVVLTIDVQNDFFHDEGYMGRLGVPLGSIQGMVPPLQSFLAAARLAEVPVMHVVSHHDEQYASPVVTEQKLRNGHDLTAHDLNGDGRAMKDAVYCCGPGAPRRSSSPGPARTRAWSPPPARCTRTTTTWSS
jgi:hypothetical protein